MKRKRVSKVLQNGGGLVRSHELTGHCGQDTVPIRSIFLRSCALKKLALVVMVGLLVILVSATTVLAAPKGTDRPFKGKAEGTSAVPVDAASCSALACFETESDGTFHGSHLGKGTYAASGTQTWVLDINSKCPGSPVIGLVFGTLTFTAANGDLLNADATSASYVCETGPPFDDLTYASTIYYVIDGGDGRFANATGEFTSYSTHTRMLCDCASVFRRSVDIGTWNGKISY